MPIQFSTARRAPARAEVVAHGLTTEVLAGDGPLPAGLDRGDLGRLGFTAKVEQVQVVPAEGRLVVAVGLGPADGVDPDGLRRASACLARAVRGRRSLALDLASATDAVPRPEAARAVVEGTALALYRFGYKSTKDEDRLSRVTLVGSTAAGVRTAVEQATAVVEGVKLARDLVNEPGGSLTPPKFANRVRRMARDRGLTVKVLDEAAIKRARLGGLLGVSRGSTQPPRFVELTWTPKGRPKGTLALVGKGLTFDSGGLSIKSGVGMMDMKMDMGGAAAVVGAMSVLPTVAPRCRVRAYLPMTDNMLGGDATRPGDVLTIRNGKTIEVLNTDAEGRLVLADALWYTQERFKPQFMIDLATLTGAIIISLGHDYAGLFSNNDGLSEKLLAAGKAERETLWRLPLPASYEKQIESPIADMKNIGGRPAGSITAGLFLQKFVNGVPWAHLDIASVAWKKPSTDPTVPDGAAGFGVRLLNRLVADAYEG
ncbi:MAG: leucyl aminopeptidase [Caulobacter sp.]|nr:leucyl aminopeptidase [Caulobacter sp.]